MFTMNKKKQPPEMFYKKAVLKNFSMIAGKDLCWSLFLMKLVIFVNVSKSLQENTCAGVSFLINRVPGV